MHIHNVLAALFYCIKVRDLLNPASNKKGGLKVRQHPAKGFYGERFVDCTRVCVLKVMTNVLSTFHQIKVLRLHCIDHRTVLVSPSYRSLLFSKVSQAVFDLNLLCRMCNFNLITCSPLFSREFSDCPC